jgi:hypothetical protein
MDSDPFGSVVDALAVMDICLAVGSFFTYRYQACYRSPRPATRRWRPHLAGTRIALYWLIPTCVSDDLLLGTAPAAS